MDHVPIGPISNFVPIGPLIYFLSPLDQDCQTSKKTGVLMIPNRNLWNLNKDFFLRGPPPLWPIFAILRDSLIIFSDMFQTDPKRSEKISKKIWVSSQIPNLPFYHFIVVRGKSISSYSFQYFFKIPKGEYSQSPWLRFVFSFFWIFAYSHFHNQSIMHS